MGTVFLAEDPVIGRRVALKVIRMDDTGSAEQQRQLAQSFLKETRLAGLLQHPGVVSVFDAGKEDNAAYIVMEFVDGTTFDAMLRAKPRAELAELLGICRQTATVLDYAHAQGVIHRDIKPTNILVQADGKAKVCDFGIAKVMQSAEMTLTQTGIAVGTPDYMSPEQVLGQPLDGRSDQWSLAVVTYQVVTGVRPFRADNFTQVMARIMTLDPEPPCKENPDLPKSVDAVFARALAKKPTERFATCGEFMDALEKACAAATVRAAALPAAPTRESAGVEPVSQKKSRRLVAMAGILLIAVAGAAAWGLLHRKNDIPVAEVGTPVPPQAPRADLAAPVPPPIAATKKARPAGEQRAAPEKTAPEMHAVRLVTVPESAEVTVDNSPDSVCKSPCTVELAAGQHTISAKKDGFYPLVKTFGVDLEQPEVSFPLSQIMGSVMIETDPPGASIALNGTSRSETTPANIKLPVGQYKVTLTKEGFAPFDYEVTVRADALSKSKATLAKSSH